MLALLVDHAIEQELDNRAFTAFRRGRRGDVMAAMDESSKAQAQAHTRRMQEISKAIGAGRLDAFLDYRRSLPGRISVDIFDKSLPADNKLTADQKEAMALLVAQDFQRQARGFRFGGLSRINSLHAEMATVEQRNRSMQLHSLAMNERSLEEMANAQREMQEQLTSVLTPEQSEVYAKQQQQMQDGQRAWIDAAAQRARPAFRRAAGRGPGRGSPGALDRREAAVELRDRRQEIRQDAGEQARWPSVFADARGATSRAAAILAG
ncbi:MAG: hypothetical protein HC872_09115 [Gammaproteobacteria bacterium]|nr:hypothetical protein [Gammaproteobacteria bacterium]